MTEFNLKIPTDFPWCSECRGEFAEGEERVVIVYAGSAWMNGVAEWVDGAELYRAKAFHTACVPDRGGTA